MFSLREYAATWNRNPESNFAVACAEQQSLAELEEAAVSIADPTDMETWQIDDPQEWHDAIATALWERMQPRIDALNQLIAARGLADDYGESGGLIAEYEPAVGIVIRDEAYSQTFPSEVPDETIAIYLQGFLDDRAANQ